MAAGTTEILVHSDTLATPTNRLHRFFTVPPGPPIARIILLHGYGDHAGKYLHILSWMAEHGLAAEATDFRGHGRSTGRVAYVTRWEEYLDDLAAMIAGDRASRMENRGSKVDDRGERSSSSVDPRSPPPPWFIVAHSHGALVAVIAALRGMLDGCAGVILSAPFLEFKIPVHWTKWVFAMLASRILPGFAVKSGIVGPMLTHDPEYIEINKTDPYCPGIATPRWFTATRQLQAEARGSAGKFTLPLLMLIAGDDVIADARASVAFFEQCGSTDKQIRHYPQLRHELLREVGREAIFAEVLEWIEQHRLDHAKLIP